MKKFLLPLVALVCSAASSHALISIDFVTVGDPGNPNDPSDGDSFAAGVQNYGSVGYIYQIGKYEVTLLQYTAFLNAVAATDPYGMYNPAMATSIYIAGIARAGSSGSYTYSVIGDGNRPVIDVNWFDAARFVNWVHNGQPNGAPGPTTTERGAYTLNGATTGTGYPRTANATYWIPTENEWYKAAYYQPTSAGGDSDSYWLYPMQTNLVPYSDQPPGTTPDNTRVGNFYKEDGVANGYDDGWAVTGSTSNPTGNALTPVGAYTASDSYYGTFDQGGNAYEWNDTPYGSGRNVLRGGSFFGSKSENNLRSSFRTSGPADSDFADTGFRVAGLPVPPVPEPSTAGLLGVGLVLLAARRRRAGGTGGFASPTN